MQNIILLNDETVPLYERGKKDKNDWQKALKKGTQALQEKTKKSWEPLLNEGLEKAIAAPKKWTASDLAGQLVTSKLNVYERTEGMMEHYQKDSIRKALRNHDRIRPLLKR